jgi:hypothetical protein
MTEHEAITIAQAFAKAEHVSIGPVLNVLHDPTPELRLVLEGRGIDPKPRDKWRILFERLDGGFDPGSIMISVYSGDGRAVFENNL